MYNRKPKIINKFKKFKYIEEIIADIFSSIFIPYSISTV